MYDQQSVSFIGNRNFHRPDLGPNIIPNSLALQFGENFMKIRTKIAKLWMLENLNKNVNENVFSFTFLCKFS